MAKKPKRSPSANRVSNRRKSKAIGALTVFEHLSLAAVRLLDLNAKLHVIDGKVPNKPRLETTVSVGASQGSNEAILVDAIVNIESRPDSDPESDSILAISVHLQCVYRIEGKKTEEFEKHSTILAQSATVVMWPHFREIIQSITSRMTIKPIILPMYLANAKGEGQGQRVTLREPED